MKIWELDKDLIVRTAEESDIEYLKNRLRPSDVDEVWASGHQTPEEALKGSFKASTKCFTMVYKGLPCAMFGATPDPARHGYGCVWLLATEELKFFRYSFLRVSRRFMDELLRYYNVLFNLVDNRNKTSIKWLKWCGAAMALPAPFGPDGHLFRYFEIRRRDHV